MKNARLASLLILFEITLLLAGNGMIGLFESSEARYAEVSREMIETGDFLSPQMDYVYHFTKPPMTYWLTSLGMTIFGTNPFGARFFVTLFAILTMVVVYLSGREDDEEEGFYAFLILGASPLFFIMAKVLTTDIFLTFFVALGYYFFKLMERGRLSRIMFELSFGAVAAMSILTKGQVPILYWALIFGGLALFRRDWGPLKTLLSPILLITMAALSGWWFIAVGLKHPGLLQYLFLKESVEASYSANRFHPGPVYYYIPVMLGALFPFWFLTPSPKKLFGDDRFTALIGYTVFPLFLFSLFPAKLPTYLLPSMPGWALLLAGSVKGASRKRVAWMCSSLFVLQAAIALFIFVRGGRYIRADFTDVVVIMAAGAGVSLAGLCLALRKRSRAALIAVFLSLLSAGIAAPSIVAKHPEKFKIAERTALSIRQKIHPEDKVMELRTTAFSIPFYLERKVYAFENNFFRKKFLREKPPHILQGKEELDRFIAGNPAVWVLVDKKSEPYLKEHYPSFRLFASGDRYIVYVSPEVADRISK